MRCFEFEECALDGILIERFPEPHVPTQGRVRLLLDPRLKRVIRQIPKETKGRLLLHSATLIHQDSGRRVLLAPVPREWQDERALVWVTTATLKGTIGVTASSKEGARIVGGHAAPIRLTNEVAKLEVLIEVLNGGSFTIRRTGELAGAPAEIVVRWDGQELLDEDERARLLANKEAAMRVGTG